jgi:hypothetical protein
LGWFAAAAAPTAGAELPLGDVLPISAFARPWSDAVFRSVVGQLIVGGPMDDVDVGVMSMGSRGGASVAPEEGRMGMALCRLELCGSGEKGLRRASATDAIMAAWRAWRAAGAVVWCWDGEPLGRSSFATRYGAAVGVRV